MLKQNREAERVGKAQNLKHELAEKGNKRSCP